MKLRGFQISNYKNLQKISVENISDLHTFIGKNSSGKSTILQAISLIKNVHSELPNPQEIISGGIDEYDSKIIEIDLELEIEKNFRKNYLLHFFRVEPDQVDNLITNNDYLSKIRIFLQVQIYGDRHTQKVNQNIINISRIQILINGAYVNIVEPIAHGTQIRYKNIIGNQPANSITRNFPHYFDSITSTDVTITQSFQPKYFQTTIIEDVKKSLNYIQSIRESLKAVSVSTIDHAQVSDKGQELINLMDTMNTNDRERYSEIEAFCKNIFKDIENIRPNRRSDNNVRILIKRKNQPWSIDLVYEGTGIDQLLIIIWKIATSEPGTIWFLDEPELHIHPGAQKLLYDFLRNETCRGKQILVATHSMVFMYKSSEKETTVALEENGFANMISLDQLIQTEKENREVDQTDEIRKIIYEVLGYDPEMGFEPQKIIMVEGKADQKIFKIFAETLENPINDRTTKFIIIGDKTKTKQFAPILSFAMSGKKSLIILDNDLDDPKEIKKSILIQEQNYRKQLGMEAPLLTDENFSFYDEDVYSIEDFLLEPEAIAKTGDITEQGKLDSIKLKIKTELDKPKKDRMKPKELLKNIWEENALKPYQEVETAKNIALNISSKFLKRHPELIEMISKISS